MNGKSIFKIVGVIFLIILLLSGMVIAIFNGVVEIIEEVLGNIVGFLNDPLGFIREAAQTAWNTVVTFNPLDSGRKLYI